jgi:signal peptidase I
MATPMKYKVLQLLKNKVIHLLLLLVIMAIIFKTGFRVVYNYGGSMEPTLRSHQLLLLNKVWYDILSVERYDVVMLYDTENKEYLVKRIIGLPNETIEIKEGVILLDGKPLQGDSIRITYENASSVNLEPLKIPPDGYFYIGDDREDSVSGIVLDRHIRGKVMFVK